MNIAEILLTWSTALISVVTLIALLYNTWYTINNHKELKEYQHQNNARYDQLLEEVRKNSFAAGELAERGKKSTGQTAT